MIEWKRNITEKEEKKEDDSEEDQIFRQKHKIRNDDENK